MATLARLALVLGVAATGVARGDPVEPEAPVGTGVIYRAI